MHILSRQNPRSGAVERPVATVTSVPVLLFKMRCMFFFTVENGLCSLRKKYSFLFFPSCQFFSVEAASRRPLIIVYALASQTVFSV